MFLRCLYNRAVTSGTLRWMQSVMAAAESPPAAKRKKEDADISIELTDQSREVPSECGLGYMHRSASPNRKLGSICCCCHILEKAT